MESQVLTVLRNRFKQLVAKAERAAQTARRRLETRRIERKYPAQPQRSSVPMRGIGQQASAMADIIQQHCSNGGAIVRMHNDATMKLDAAEYALSSMLDELKGAMTTLPTTWTPVRTWSETSSPAPAFAPEQAKAA